MTGPEAAAPILIGCGHGTRDPAGRAAVGGLLDDVRAARPGLDVCAAFVDVQTPEIDEVVAGVLDARTAVVVPLLLSAGFHVQVDIARAIRQRPGSVVAAPTLGPDEHLVAILLDRLAEAGARPGDAVVLAPAGSSDARATAQADAMLTLLREAWSGPAVLGFAAAGTPLAPEAVARLRADGAECVVVASYLLAPGLFQVRLRAAGADAVTEPLAPHPRLVELVLDRYDAGVALLKGNAPVHCRPRESGKMDSC